MSIDIDTKQYDTAMGLQALGTQFARVPLANMTYSASHNEDAGLNFDKWQ